MLVPAKSLRSLAALSLFLSLAGSALADPPVRRGSIGGRGPGPGHHYEPPPVMRGSQGGPGRGRPAMRCPPYTVFEARVGRCVADPYGRRGLPERRPTPRGNDRDDRDERSAANLVNASLRGLDCGQAGDALRRLSNAVLSLQAENGSVNRPGRGGGNAGEEVRRRWREHVSSPKFWQKVWNHMADVYRSCNRTCFDDGEAIGQISATVYCSASVAVDGLPGIGLLEQPPLPVCETAVFAGCLNAYGDTAAATAGCAPYTTNQYAGIFAEYESQDCHL